MRNGRGGGEKLLNGYILPSIKFRRNKLNNPENYPRREKPKGKLSCRDWCHTEVRADLHRAGSVHTRDHSCASLGTCCSQRLSHAQEIPVEEHQAGKIIMQGFYLMHKPSCIHQGKECVPVLLNKQ